MIWIISSESVWFFLSPEICIKKKPMKFWTSDGVKGVYFAGNSGAWRVEVN